MNSLASPQQQTTTTGTPHLQNYGIEDMFSMRDLIEMSERFHAGADPNVEFYAFGVEDGRRFEDLTATSMAVLADADAGEVLYTPLVLNRGGRIDQVDSRGRTLLSFAFTRPIFEYLAAHGAPLPELQGDAGGVPPQLPCPDPMPMDEWRALADLSLVKSLDDLGYHQTCAGAHASGPPLMARLSPARLMDDALWDGDEARIRRLIELGGGFGRQRFTFCIERGDVEFNFDGLTAVSVAMLADCRDGDIIDDTGDMPVRAGEVRLLALFDGVVPLDGPQDEDGNTLLHLVCAPVVAEWLLRRGLPLDAVNSKGQSPLEYPLMPDDVRAFIEQWALDNSVLGAVDNGESGRGRRRL